MIRKIEYIYYPVTNMDRSVRFYRDVLGLKNLLFQRKDWSEFELNGQKLALEHVETIAPHSSGATVSFYTDPIETFVQELKQKGVTVLSDVVTHPYGKLATIQDPDGNTIGLYTPPGKSAASKQK